MSYCIHRETKKKLASVLKTILSSLLQTVKINTYLKPTFNEANIAKAKDKNKAYGNKMWQ